MSPSAGTRRIRDHSAGDVLGVVADKQTYKNLGYLLLAFPLGIAYHMLLLFGFAFGAILSVLGIGVALILGTIVGSRVLAGFERWLANALLGLDLRSPEDARTSSATGLWSTAKGYLEAASTWRGLGFLMLKLWVGIVGLVLLIALLGTLSVVTAPLHYPYEAELITVNDEAITWTIETLPEALLAVPVGAVLGLVLLHVTNAIGYVVERMALALLDDPATVADQPAEQTDPAESN